MKSFELIGRMVSLYTTMTRSDIKKTSLLKPVGLTGLIGASHCATAFFEPPIYVFEGVYGVRSPREN